jgi:hypothetical protein
MFFCLPFCAEEESLECQNEKDFVLLSRSEKKNAFIIYFSA